MPWRRRRPRRHRGRGRRRGRPLWRALILVDALAVETVSVWTRAHRLGGRIIVRCRDGHLFTTIWIPGASVKAIRLGPWRMQRCPVGPHWSWVTPVDEHTLSETQRREARARQDRPIP